MTVSANLITDGIINKSMSAVPMPLYECHKEIHALPMSRGVYNQVRGWDIPSNENPDDEGYLTCYNRGTDDEHVSWSPKKVFDDGHTLLTPDVPTSGASEVNSFESKILEVIAQEKTLPIVTIYGVLNLISSDLLNKASVARLMFSAGRK